MAEMSGCPAMMRGRANGAESIRFEEALRDGQSRNECEAFDGQLGEANWAVEASKVGGRKAGKKIRAMCTRDVSWHAIPLISIRELLSPDRVLLHLKHYLNHKVFAEQSYSGLWRNRKSCSIE